VTLELKMSSPRGFEVGGMAGICILRAEPGCCVMACRTSPTLGLSADVRIGVPAFGEAVFGDDERAEVMIEYRVLRGAFLVLRYILKFRRDLFACGTNLLAAVILSAYIPLAKKRNNIVAVTSNIVTLR
jgi:hypothetical protein